MPARIVLRTIGADGKDILPFLQRRRQIHTPRHIAIRPAADERAIEPHKRKRHRAVAVEEKTAILLLRQFALRELDPAIGGLERVAVPRRPRTRQITVERMEIIGEGIGDCGVMRHADGRPILRLERRLQVGMRHPGLRSDACTRRTRQFQQIAALPIQHLKHRGNRELPQGTQRLVLREQPAVVQFNTFRACGRKQRQQRRSNQE